MTDLTVRAPCEHGRWESHLVGPAFEHVCKEDGCCERCEGGREIRLRRREAFEPGVDWSVRDKVWVEVTNND